MSPTEVVRASRRSTRVPLQLVIEVLGSSEKLVCEGETIIVNLHGALISTAIPIGIGTSISVHVYLTGQRVMARVVHVNPEEPLHSRIELQEPQNNWGVSLPPDDWVEDGTLPDL